MKKLQRKAKPDKRSDLADSYNRNQFSNNNRIRVPQKAANYGQVETVLPLLIYDKQNYRSYHSNTYDKNDYNEQVIAMNYRNNCSNELWMMNCNNQSFRSKFNS